MLGSHCDIVTLALTVWWSFFPPVDLGLQRLRTSMTLVPDLLPNALRGPIDPCMISRAVTPLHCNPRTILTLVPDLGWSFCPILTLYLDPWTRSRVVHLSLRIWTWTRDSCTRSVDPVLLPSCVSNLMGLT